MFEQFKRLFRDFSFLLKILQLIIAGVCLDELRKYNEYSIPRWLWVIYCIDTSMYTIIYFCIAMAHIFEKRPLIPSFSYFSLGAVLHFIGAVAGFARSHYADLDQTGIRRSELKIGLLLFANFIVLFGEAATIAYAEYSRAIKSSTTNR